ncbi:P63C domain-containing protein, partial [Paenibacillus graminis]|uniref:P63C domain-containing protein n=1 Tax=Paenibacillus graminis TaxID=189425 RepID=UPI0030C95834
MSQTGLVRSLGMKRGGKGRAGGDRLLSFVTGKGLEPFISKELLEASTNPIKFKTTNGNLTFGYEAQILSDICESVLAARKAGVLQKQQLHIAEMCEMLMRGFARVGIIALVDEATGYERVRDKDELQKFLALYLSEERLHWAKMFPDEYYKQLFRLRGWDYSPLSVKRPKFVGWLTNELVYKKLPANVLDELRTLNPVKNKKTWRRSSAHFQHLSSDIGQPDLRDHLLQLIAIM